MLRITSVLICVLAILFGCAACAQGEGLKMEPLFGHVFELPTYTELDGDFAAAAVEKALNMGGGCTAVAALTDEGEMLVGRNMDLYISHKPAYIIRTKVDGCYDTIALSYYFSDFVPDYEEVMENGLGSDTVKLLPFLCTDFLNSEGLYIETNMRNGECWPTGDGKFTCAGTNPASDQRMFITFVPRYVAMNCATVEEAVEYIRGLDIYTQPLPTAWNFCFMIADATGRYGVMEVACDQTVWHEGQRAQTNFYLTEEFAAMEQLGAGYGRYDLVLSGADDVQSEEDMFALIDSATYFQMYDPENCAFDLRSELVGTRPWWTADYVLDEANRTEVEAEAQRVHGKVSARSREELEDLSTSWESVFTVVANCSRRTLRVRFFENDDYTTTLGFDE